MDFHRLYGGGGRVVRSVVATEPVSKTEARPPARVMNRFAVASEPKKQVLSQCVMLINIVVLFSRLFV